MVEAERDHRRSFSPTSLLTQGQVEHIPWDCVQMALEILQGWKLCNLSGQPLPVVGHPHSKEAQVDCLVF